MPHISVKMLKGRTTAQKEELAQELSKTLQKVMGLGSDYVTVSVQDFTAQEWQDVFQKEIKENENVIIKPKYDPKSLI